MKLRYIPILTILVLLASVMLGGNAVSAQVAIKDGITAAVDSIAGVKPEDKRQVADTSRFKKERVDLDHVVNFSAKDSMVLYGKDKARMFGDGAINYGDIKLTASRLNMDMAKSEVYAIGAIDTSGEVAGNPVFKDNSGSYEAKTMTYNFKTEKGLITDIVTEQGEGYLTGGITNKVVAEDFYIQDAKYTTSDEHDHPHFYFKLTKGKIRPKKDVVTGPAYMVLEDLPLPIAVPFGFFPFTEKFHSGVLVPTFGEDYQRGFFLRNGGYYLALSDYADLALTGELYTRGGWGITAQSNYAKRYKYHGNFNLSYLVTVNGEKGDKDYSKMKNFRIQWTHSQDQKANPNMSFSASVNFATSGYSRNNLDDYYNSNFTENTKSSTVNMTYKRPGSRWSFSTTASVSQRTADSTLAVSFPNLTVTMSQFAPFKRKKAVGDERWYEKIKISYSGRFQNSLTAKQDVFFKKSLVKDWRNGMTHTVPISATFNLFKYLNVTPSITLNDRMYTSKIRQQWDPNLNGVVRDTTYNFYNVFDFNFSLSFSTKLYGFFKPLKIFGDKVNMIRHVITPSVSFSASPDFGSPFWGYYGQYERVNPDGTKEPVKYSYFSHGLFGNASSGKSGVVSFNVSNNIEAKVKSDADSTGFKKVSIIENLSLSQSYNFAVDSLRWSNLNTSILLRLTKGFNLNLSATWDVYKYGVNKYGTPVRINKLRLFHGGGWGRLASTGTSFNYTLNNATFKNLFGRGKKGSSEKTKSVFDNQQQQQSQKDGSDQRDRGGDGEFDADGYLKWDCPWSLTFNYSLNYGYGDFDYDRMEYKGRWTQNLSLSGNIRPTKNWSISMSASYNFDLKKIAYMNCNISREMHCFTMSASFVPVGPYKSYSFHIAVKSSILSDVKYDKHSSSGNGVNWY
ncbi:MAG: putative LPS assembly protein LptD [Bacteroidales bacterium]|nr:putative LPS assembly protein LptD [Bacteroidales bacterium]